MATYVLGISAFYHDSAAALVKDGVPVAAAQEERFTRVRHDAAFPANAIKYCLDAEGIGLDELTAVVYYEDPQEKFSRMISSFASGGISGARTFISTMPEWIRWKLNVLKFIDEKLEELGRGTGPLTIASQHHRSHAAAAFFPSPFEQAAVLCIDGIGEWHSTTIWKGDGSKLDLMNSISYPHSVGLFYSAFTYYCGFKVDSGEYKLMGLAPYGRPIYADKIRKELINIRADGSFTLNMKYFEYLRGERMVGEAFEELFGGPVRKPESPITQRECDLAASVQQVTEEVVLGLATAAVRQTGYRNLCLAGGVALNCVANGVLSRSGRFDAIWIQPAAGDAGCALGAAMDYSVKRTGRPHLGSKKLDAMSGSLLGPGFGDEEIQAFLDANQYPYQRFEGAELYDETARHLADGAVVGWFQGRMEFGPRALGARSILGDPRNPEMQRTMNLKIKYRESFRPFAPAVLDEDAQVYFDICEKSPYMLMVSQVTDSIKTAESLQPGGPERGLGSINSIRSQLPAVTHVDLSARVQTVTEENNAPFTHLLRSFKKRTGCSVLVNTSFNVRGEPIVCKPEEAYACFMRTEMDVLVLGSFILERTAQPEFVEEVDWRNEIPLD
ncbi:carbamoyltransferase family protein [Pseudomonas chlororaphis]|jgi:carbamoyltransferase|uniref:Carbamoyltransferase n=1 Tax=Pseudomonas chlororaphis subsp. aurantiaca TaxID=86192 RepID=A0AAJ0ZI59_9PSED|nr:carbamoyltransferase [Pseudomonas chlororaphis]MBU4633057.1 carbamoyltransferase [Pseudomonas chlororaphis subsp. aurantiaca]